MIAIDSAVLLELLSGSAQADAAEAALRDALSRGPVVVCDVVVGEVCSALRDGDQAMQVLDGMGIGFSPLEEKSAVRAGEMHRRYRAREAQRELADRADRAERTERAARSRGVPDFLIGAHALLQCSGLITRDEAFFRDYFKGLRVIVPTSTPSPSASS